MNNFVFVQPTKYLFGKNQLEHLADEIKIYGNKVLLIYGKNSIKKIGLYVKIINSIKDAGLELFELGGVDPNPRVATAREGIHICRREKIDFILAAGGGSTIDCAKAIAAGSKHSGDVWDFYSRKSVILDALPLGTILTVPAAGSEMNGNSVLTNWEQNEKLPVNSPFLIPRFSIVDPQLTYSLSPIQTACGAVDTIIHIMEMNIVKQKGTMLQDLFSESIIKTIIGMTPIAISEPENFDARSNLAMASTWAFHVNYGKDEDWATHRIEHELSALYDVTHAVGLSIIWPNWADYVLDRSIDRFYDIAKRVWNVSSTERSKREVALEGINLTRKFFKSIGLPKNLKEIGINNSNFELISQKATRWGNIGTVMALNSHDVQKILEMSL